MEKIIRADSCNVDKMYGMVKKHKAANPLHVKTSGCNTVVEKFSILIEKTLYPLADRLNSKIKDTNNMLEIKNDINKSVLSENCVLESFDVVNMFPNIDNKSGLLSVKEVLTDSNFDADSTQFIKDALEICLTCNNSRFNHCALRTNGTAQGPDIYCSYADIAMAKYDSLANKFHLKPGVWKRFRDYVFVLWEHGTTSLSSFLDYLNNMDKTGKIKFTMEIAGDTGLELLDLKLKINKGKIRRDVYAKSFNSFSYITTNTCYPKSNICNIPRGIALRLVLSISHLRSAILKTTHATYLGV